MIRFTFAIFALGCFVQLVNGQDECEGVADALTVQCLILLTPLYAMDHVDFKWLQQ